MTPSLSALIVDDEAFGRNNLKTIFNRFINEVQVLGEANSVAQLRNLLPQHQPDVVFLDIRMPGTDGIEFLESEAKRDYDVVLVTAYDDYGIRALKAGATDYVMKPLDIDELRQAVKKVQDNRSRKSESDEPTPTQKDTRIRVPHSRGISLISPADIVRIEADNNYVTIYYEAAPSLTIAKTIKDMEARLAPLGFFRIHKSHLINLSHLSGYSHEDGGQVVMSDRCKLTVSKRRLGAFLKRIEDDSLSIR